MRGVDAPCQCNLPSHTLAAIARYVDRGIPTGGFLEAVITNDLKEACAAADSENRYALFEIVAHLYNCEPSPCWGSREKWSSWLARFRRESPPESDGLDAEAPR